MHPGNSDWCVGIEWLVVFCLCQGLPLMDWGHSSGGRVDDEAVAAISPLTGSAVWLWICSPNDILLLND